jgi:hypothetical protein
MLFTYGPGDIESNARTIGQAKLLIHNAMINHDIDASIVVAETNTFSIFYFADIPTLMTIKAHRKTLPVLSATSKLLTS